MNLSFSWILTEVSSHKWRVSWTEHIWVPKSHTILLNMSLFMLVQEIPKYLKYLIIDQKIIKTIRLLNHILNIKAFKSFIFWKVTLLQKIKCYFLSLQKKKANLYYYIMFMHVVNTSIICLLESSNAKRTTVRKGSTVELGTSSFLSLFPYFTYEHIHIWYISSSVLALVITEF